MDHKDAKEWKHTTAKSIFEAEDDGIDLFDDEQPGHVTIYKRLKNGNRWPCRSVCLENYDHATSVLGAWVFNRKVNDYRTFANAPQTNGQRA